MKKKIFILLMVLLSTILVSCGGISMKYYDNLGEEYNQNLFYRNELNTPTPDPSVIFITEGEDKGYFYVYGTTDALGATGIHAYRTKNFNSWELMEKAFVPQRDSWAIRDIWAPEVVYKDGLYYMYYSGSNQYEGNRKGIGVAISEHPAGPFLEYTGTTIDGRELTHKDQPIVLPFTAIDASPFLDKSGDMYLYFAKDQVGNISSIWGVKLKDEVTFDESTLVELAQPTFSSLELYENSSDRVGDIKWETSFNPNGYDMWNEGPFMYEENGVYFLTYSSNPYWAREYAVGFATSDSPLGTFVKPSDNRILGIDQSWDHMSGTGHHSFFKVGEQLYIAYHAHVDRVFGGNGARALAIDEVFISGSSIHVNGPTYSTQPLPSFITGYKNIMSKAKITSKNTKDDLSLLNDNLFSMHLSQSNLEVEFAKGKTKITIEFDSDVTVRGILIYNSVDYEKAVFNIDKINFSNELTINKLGFNPMYVNKEDKDFIEMRPGGSFIAEFNEVTTNKITIEIDSTHNFNLSEIVILGK